MRQLVTILFVTFIYPLFATETQLKDNYSREPLNNPVFEYSQVVSESIALNNWLSENYKNVTNQNVKNLREHLYYLICSDLAAIYKKDKTLLPKDEDSILQALFWWSEKLGAYGGTLVYNQIKSKNKKPIPELMEIPDTFRLTLKQSLFHLESSSNTWAVEFPYYFMISRLMDYKATNGMQMQLASISTYASKDNSKLGRSQGTIMLVYSPVKKYDSFSNYWVKQLGMEKQHETRELGIQQLKSLYSYDQNALLHKEIVTLKGTKGSYALVYIGLDGTYQSNRQNFLDFINHFRFQ